MIEICQVAFKKCDSNTIILLILQPIINIEFRNFYNFLIILTKPGMCFDQTHGVRNGGTRGCWDGESNSIYRVPSLRSQAPSI
jgi:hypothetical protein